MFAFAVAVGSSSRWRSTASRLGPLDVTPRYDANRNLILPDDYRSWVLVGSSLGLSYTESSQNSHQMFNTTLMEPSAYRHFVATGTFREGTVLALIG